MKYGICNLPIIPLRGRPSHTSEMTSQVLFGECFEILDNQQEWSLIKLAHDGYEGWVDAKQITTISSEFFKDITEKAQTISDLTTHGMLMKLGHDEMLHLLPGSTLPKVEDEEEALFRIGETEYMFLGLVREPESTNFRNEVEEVSRFYLNAPYLWGGRSLFGIDCSGFTQLVYKHFGINIQRDAYQQATEGKAVDFLQQATTGDLAFFDREDGKITHVGILISESEIIHASGRVRVDKIDENGIFNRETQKYTHRLRTIKRLVN